MGGWTCRPCRSRDGAEGFVKDLRTVMGKEALWVGPVGEQEKLVGWLCWTSGNVVCTCEG